MSQYHIGETPSQYGGGKPHPESEWWLKYPWPATRLTSEDMEMLCVIRRETGKPITQLLHEAVEVMYELFRNEG
jgi:hypothetical protein